MRRRISRATAELARAVSYSPDLDGAADPGEIVWTWVEFEDDPTQGKDRPVLVVGRDRNEEQTDDVLGLMLSSKEYHRDDANWESLGSGAWDTQHRESFVRLDRVLVVDADGIRREGAILPREQFDAVASRLRHSYGWR
ncbi:type II toxin-antitoxin system PemK/MazF family toxin [Gordonia sp. DT30]|uniref:type II toxin-antitoxin system PemK/MazF family toxin n=1 Tax=unclassified Gordonia (in: high G+C Gram-positive bacteria) TaxID=2657482 RepID=UPI003CF23ADA